MLQKLTISGTVMLGVFNEKAGTITDLSDYPVDPKVYVAKRHAGQLRNITGIDAMTKPMQEALLPEEMAPFTLAEKTLELSIEGAKAQKLREAADFLRPPSLSV